MQKDYQSANMIELSDEALASVMGGDGYGSGGGDGQGSCDGNGYGSGGGNNNWGQCGCSCGDRGSYGGPLGLVGLNGLTNGGGPLGLLGGLGLPLGL